MNMHGKDLLLYLLTENFCAISILKTKWLTVKNTQIILNVVNKSLKPQQYQQNRIKDIKIGNMKTT